MFNFPEIWCVHICFVWYNLSYIAVCTHYDTNSIYFTSAVFKRNHEVRDRWRLYGKSSFLASNSVNYNSFRENIGSIPLRTPFRKIISALGIFVIKIRSTYNAPITEFRFLRRRILRNLWKSRQ